MRKVKIALLTSVVAILTFFASISAASACLFGWYQPKTPKCLQK